MSSIMTGIIGSVSAALPLKILAGATALFGGAAWVAGGNGRFKTLGAQALHATDGVQEGILTGFANGLLGATSAFNGGVQSGAPVSKAARLIAKVEAPLEALFFGDRLVVTQPHPQTAPIAASATIDDALANLDALNAPNNGLDYGTVAVQKYVDAQGASRWLVLIPGTDTHADTAIGWGQNIELMSSDNEQRLHADSSRLVMEAMERSGIGKDEPVTLVGHSQGGIVAASLAAGLADKYTISHVVTAGSPIANHPIPEKTWVTSIENKGELVSNLDGSRNPDRPTWLTVRGTINPADSNALESSGPLARASATGVANAPEHADITHAMNYQRATWTNAESLGSPALTEHDKHFQEQIKGTLKTTSYYTGRMEH
jgi:predicted alpha/beta hydrolase family esterase